jgi:hypothetical protein
MVAQPQGPGPSKESSPQVVKPDVAQIKRAERVFHLLAIGYASAMREQINFTRFGFTTEGLDLYTARALIYSKLAKRIVGVQALFERQVAIDLREHRPVAQLEFIRRTLTGNVQDLKQTDESAYKPEPMHLASKSSS